MYDKNKLEPITLRYFFIDKPKFILKEYFKPLKHWWFWAIIIPISIIWALLERR